MNDLLPVCVHLPLLASFPPLSVRQHNHTHTVEITLYISCHCGRVQGRPNESLTIKMTLMMAWKELPKISPLLVRLSSVFGSAWWKVTHTHKWICHTNTFIPRPPSRKMTIACLPPNVFHLFYFKKCSLCNWIHNFIPRSNFLWQTVLFWSGCAALQPLT